MNQGLLVTAGTLATKTWARLSVTTSATPGTVTSINGASLPVAYAYFKADGANTDAVGIGPTTDADMLSVAVGLPNEVDPPALTAIDLVTWKMKSTGASQVVVIFYCPA
jgi:hypothetical protein